MWFRKRIALDSQTTSLVQSSYASGMSTDIKQHDNQQDFDSCADKLWSVYNKEAESHDRALMETWKDDMNSIIIFAGLFSGVLTAFLVNASKNLKADPTEQTNALLSQAVVLLAQISQQLGPNGSQTIISPLQPLEPFKLKPSDLRVNIFWYMGLGFSIAAAGGATFLQLWVRNYLQVFQGLSGSLERSRMRQYLFHGVSSNYMSLIVEWIPVLIHISFFLFFLGLAENLFAINHAVAITTTIIICYCTVCYMGCSVFPVLYPQTPFYTPLSTVYWRIAQIIRPRKHSDRNTKGKIVPVSPDMAKGRLQLAMSRSNNRIKRDTDAIRWVLSKITEDSEFEPFAAGIGGSVVTPWGRDIWKSIFGENPGNMPSTPYNTEIASNTVQILKIRIESLLHTVSTFSDQQTRFTRACVCIDAVASLTLGFKAELELDIDGDLVNSVLRFFGDERKRRVKRVVQDAETSFGSAMNLRQLSDNQVMDTSLDIKWKCLKLIGMRKILQSDCWAFVLRHSDRPCLVDDELLKAWKAAGRLYSELHDKPEEQLTEDWLNKLAPHWRDYVDEMEESLSALDQRVPFIDSDMINLNSYLCRLTAVDHLDGIFYEWPTRMNLSAMCKGINLGATPPDWDPLKWFIPHLIPPRLLIGHLLVCADPRRQPNFDRLTSRIDVVGLDRLLNNPELHRLFNTQLADGTSGLELPCRTSRLKLPGPYKNQLWRFEDISKHGGVGFMIEVFFATFKSLGEKSMTPHSEQLIMATLGAISDNGKSEHFRTASRRFLRSLRQEINILWNSNQEAKTHIVFKLLRELFDDSDRHCPDEEREKEEGEGEENGNE
ncbi:hypothetical protein BYT27DRAFT_7131987 [Phlegmacium glaucopus]|nr:hypothetical protein BYT27DRAFT_7131987 [Phlegmacium glaucopus]